MSEGDISFNERERLAAVARANAWTAGQAARLNTSPEAILEAILRGPWLPEQIEEVTSKYQLEDDPTKLVGVEPRVDAAIEKRAKAKARAKGDTAMAAAYQMAKDRAASLAGRVRPRSPPSGMHKRLRHNGSRLPPLVENAVPVRRTWP